MSSSFRSRTPPTTRPLNCMRRCIPVATAARRFQHRPSQRTVVLLTDTHYGPIDRTRWSTRVVDAVNALDADIVCHTGDIADGTVEQRRQAGTATGTSPGAGRNG